MRNIITNIGWVFFDKLFRMATGILVGVWIARYLGPTDFGILNYALLFPTIFSSIAGLGLTNILMVEYVAAGDDSDKKNELLSTSIFIKLVVGTVTYGLTLLLNYFINRESHSLFALINITGSILVLQSVDVIDTYFQSITKAKLSVLVKLIAFSLSTGIRVYGLVNKYGIVFFAAINVLELIMSYALMLGAYQYHSKQLIKSIVYSINAKLARALIHAGWPIMFTEFFVYVYMKIDQFMIESLSTNRELGIYGAALRLSEPWYFIAIAICSSLYPKIAELWLVNKTKFYERYQYMLNILVYISIILSVFFSVFSDTLMGILYGPKFDGAGDVLCIHIWAGVFVFVGVGVNNLMIIKKLQKFFLLKTVFAACLNIVLNLWLIPIYGAVGASIATLISYGMSAYGLNFFYAPSKMFFYMQTRSFLNFITLKNPVKSKSIINLKQQTT